MPFFIPDDCSMEKGGPIVGLAAPAANPKIVNRRVGCFRSRTALVSGAQPHPAEKVASKIEALVKPVFLSA